MLFFFAHRIFARCCRNRPGQDSEVSANPCPTDPAVSANGEGYRFQWTTTLAKPSAWQAVDLTRQNVGNEKRVEIQQNAVEWLFRLSQQARNPRYILPLRLPDLPTATIGGFSEFRFQGQLSPRGNNWKEHDAAGAFGVMSALPPGNCPVMRPNQFPPGGGNWERLSWAEPEERNGCGGS